MLPPSKVKNNPY